MGNTIQSELRKDAVDMGGVAERTALEIEGYDSMEPFLMTLVSDSDLWMYVSSLGSLTAGRVDEDHAVFPYCVEDVVHRCAGKTGPRTALRVWREDGSFVIWEPFLSELAESGCLRKLSKAVLGNQITFEETNERLGLTFSYRWTTSDAFGFVRTAELVNHGSSVARIDVVDGLLNLIPAGIAYGFNVRMSVLVDAYTECEVDPSSGITTVSLASLIVDKPEPGEALHASVVWSVGIDDKQVLLSEDQLPAFRLGKPITAESSVRGRRANYLISTFFSLAPGAGQSWDIIADAYRSQSEVEGLRVFLTTDSNPRAAIDRSISAGAENLAKLVAAADSQQCTADGPAVEHYEACVMFNVMRGGTYANGYSVLVSDFRDFVGLRNKPQAAKHRDWLDSLPDEISYSELLASANRRTDPDLTRITYEYLPLTFSRRHGDPSRPWNRFAIRLKNADGSPLLAYEGNWRDIFQNWEALSLSYPMFLESIIAKFVNASTLDGYNPYRITREGVDWEVPNPEDAWSSMGYWGDHQVVYLLKFLEQAKQVHPDALDALLGKRIFSYANVPLRIRPYEALVKNPQSTVDFDHELNRSIEKRISTYGTDARLVANPEGEVWLVSLAEKLLIPALSKLSNLVVDGGIWMNTQRPEWNDANNALVGNGVSMVTLCYLRRYLAFCKSIFEGHQGSFEVSNEVADWLQGILNTLEAHRGILNCAQVSDEERRSLLDALGTQFSTYRSKVYYAGICSREKVSTDAAIHLCEAAIPYLDHSIRANKRADGLYHSYNLVDLRDPRRASVSQLYEMLEGQVAVLSAGVLNATQVVELIEALFASKIFREDLGTFMLYPNRKLPCFLQKNVIPENNVNGNPLLSKLVASGEVSILVKDPSGNYRFAPHLRNANVLNEALDELATDPHWADLTLRYRAETLDTYETVFGHRFFTGRSGSMYAYEGLGSIYWHMVSKLLVATQESFFLAEQHGVPCEELHSIARGYYRIRSGMGFNKTPKEFGAFPPDPYSHTPLGHGAKQPGMTGQSKEDILTRWMELGVFAKDGRIHFQPSLLRNQEFLSEPATWKIFDLTGNPLVIDIPDDGLGFTVCGVPVVYRLGNLPASIQVVMADGTEKSFVGTTLNAKLSEAIFARSGNIRLVTVSLNERQILRT